MRRLRKSIALKSLSGIVSVLILFSVIIGWIGLHVYTKSMMEQYADGAFRTAEAASLQVNPNRMAEYMREDGSLVEYQTVLHNLERMCNATGVTFIYVIQPDLNDYGHITFVFSAINKESSFTRFERGYIREKTNDDYRSK